METRRAKSGKEEKKGKKEKVREAFQLSGAPSNPAYAANVTRVALDDESTWARNMRFLALVEKGWTLRAVGLYNFGCALAKDHPDDQALEVPPGMSGPCIRKILNRDVGSALASQLNWMDRIFTEAEKIPEDKIAETQARCPRMAPTPGKPVYEK